MSLDGPFQKFYVNNMSHWIYFASVIFTDMQTTFILRPGCALKYLGVFVFKIGYLAKSLDERILRYVFASQKPF